MGIKRKKATLKKLDREERKRITIVIYDVEIEQVRNFFIFSSVIRKYFWRCRTELKRRIATGIGSILDERGGILNLDLTKRMVKGLLWSMTLYG